MKNASDWFFAAKGGHNNESHNHNDIGTFILYKGAVPIFADAGVGTYTKTTFDHNRYTIWSMQSRWHNLPAINGKPQKNGAHYKASDIVVSDKGNTRTFKLNIAGAYPSDACCESWTREYKLTDKSLTIVDEFKLATRKSADILNFLVQGVVYLPGESVNDGYVVRKNEVVIENSGVAFILSYPSSMTVSVQVKELDDPKMTGVWGTSLRRISFKGKDTDPLKGKYIFRISEL
jgi:hypothetical protein